MTFSSHFDILKYLYSYKSQCRVIELIMNKLKEKQRKRTIRHYRLRKKVSGVDKMPRLCVSRTLNHIYAQLINDITGQTILTVSTLTPDIRKSLKSGGNVAAAKIVGKRLAEEATKKGIQKVVFDRGAFPYHGRIKVLATAAREGGLKF